MELKRLNDLKWHQNQFHKQQLVLQMKEKQGIEYHQKMWDLDEEKKRVLA